MSLLAEVLRAAEVEMVLVASELLVNKGMIPHESVTLEEEEEEALLSSRFACDLVLLGPFLLTLLDWGSSALALVLLVFTDLPVC